MLDRLTGRAAPNVVASADVLLVVFTSDAGTTDDGFEASYMSEHRTADVTHAPSAAFMGECHGQTVLTDEQGVFSEGPGKYRDGATCRYISFTLLVLVCHLSHCH